MEIQINNLQNKYDTAIFREVLIKALTLAANLENLHEVEVSLSFVNNEQISKLNKSYRGLDEPTDVLSFPQNDDGFVWPSHLIQPLGDIVISLEKAFEQAWENEHGFEREVVFLAVHGFFHLAGYDHQDSLERKEMRAREELVMEELSLGRE